MPDKKNTNNKPLDKNDKTKNGGTMDDSLHSDNAYSESGLENARLLRETVMKGNIE